MSQWQRGRPTSDLYFLPEEFAQVTKTFRALQRNSPYLSELVAAGLTKKQIAARLKWSMQSLNFVLKEHDLKIDLANIHRRLYRDPSIAPQDAAQDAPIEQPDDTQQPRKTWESRWQRSARKAPAS